MEQEDPGVRHIADGVVGYSKRYSEINIGEAAVQLHQRQEQLVGVAEDFHLPSTVVAKWYEALTNIQKRREMPR